MYKIDWDIKSIKKQMDIEKKKIDKISAKIKAMKKSGEHKTDTKRYKKLKIERVDLQVGYMYLCQAIDHLSGGMLGKMSNLSMRMPRLGKRLQKFVDDKNIKLD